MAGIPVSLDVDNGNEQEEEVDYSWTPVTGTPPAHPTALYFVDISGGGVRK